MFEALCKRERCPFGVVGKATTKKQLVLTDSLLNTTPIDLPMSVLFGKPPKMHRTDVSRDLHRFSFDSSKVQVLEATKRVLRLPCVASKSFLVTIGDRSVTGLVA